MQTQRSDTTSKRRAVLLKWLQHGLPAFFGCRMLGVEAVAAG